MTRTYVPKRDRRFEYAADAGEQITDLVKWEPYEWTDTDDRSESDE